MSASSRPSTPGPAASISHGELFRLLDDAALALRLPDAVYRTAQHLIRFIPTDAPAPVSPLRVQELADLRDLDPRTVRAHIRRLAAFGLAEDTSLAGGHRCVRRQAGRIVALHGVDFSPMLGRGDALRAEAARMRLEQERRIELRAEISALRRRFEMLAAAGSGATKARELFAALPRRYAHLALAGLHAIRARLLALITSVAPIEEDAAEELSPRGASSSDQSAHDIRPYSSKDSRNPVSAFGAVEGALPADWKAELARGGQRNWSGLVAAAHARSLALGVPQATWDAAVTMIGRRRTALLTLAADAPGIRCPAAWMSALARRTGDGPIDLSANLRHLSPRRMTTC